MIEQFLEARRGSSGEDDQSPDYQKPSPQINSENSFLAALHVVRKIVRRRFSVSEQPEDASDLEQGIVLRLLNWKEKYRERSEKMSEGDWESFAARTAYNETNRHFSKKALSATEMPLDAAREIASSQPIAGDSRAELQSLAAFVWQEICRESLRQRRALLLQSRRLIVYLLTGGVRDEELARSLELTLDEWLEIKIRLPLSDASIARIVGGGDTDDNQRDIESAIKSIKKARHKARGKLRNLTNR